MQSTRIAIIVPWFGPLPAYFEIFARSVKANPILSYHLWTDHPRFDLSKEIENLYFHETSFENYCSFISSKLGITFRPAHPYKLCDVKPWLPFLHRDDLKNYEFVGFGDIDLILGDMQGHLEPFINKVDFVSGSGSMVAGHFFFMRNTNSNHQLAFRIKNWEHFLTSQRGYGIDEGAFCDVICPQLGIARRIWHRIASRGSYSRKWHILNVLTSIAQVFIPSRVHFREMHSTDTGIAPSVLNQKYTDTEWIYNGKTVVGKNNKISFPYLHFLYIKAKKGMQVDCVWSDDFYKVKDPTGKILITRKDISNIN